MQFFITERTDGFIYINWDLSFSPFTQLQAQANRCVNPFTTCFIVRENIVELKGDEQVPQEQLHPP